MNITESQFLSQVENFRGEQRRVIWPAEIRKAAIELLKDGVNIYELSQKTRISKNTFLEWQRKNARKNFKELRVAEPIVSNDFLFTINHKHFSLNVQNMPQASFIKLCQELL